MNKLGHFSFFFVFFVFVGRMSSTLSLPHRVMLSPGWVVGWLLISVSLSFGFLLDITGLGVMNIV